jgi:hypothetical protein
MCAADRTIKSALFATLCLTVAAALILLSPGATRSQIVSSRDRDAAKADMMARQRALWDLERMKRKLSMKPAEARLRYQQIKEDFEQLQIVNYNLAGEVSASPNYEQIVKEAAEVKKRAERLKINLSLPEPGKDENLKKSKDEFNSVELKGAINTLDTLVKSFVANPIFQQPGVMDMNNSGKAMGELEVIIRLSEHIHKCAEALGRTGKN